MNKLKDTILESWPMIKDDFESFTKDPYCWFITELEKAQTNKDWETIEKLIDIFKMVNSPSDTHSH
jgi:hypothetical protein